MELWLGAYNLGLIYGFLALGVFITSRILDFADITVDGTFTTGAAVGAILLVNGVNPVLAILAAFAAGMICGFLTGFIHTKFKIDSLLAGILVMTALYSINLHIMGRSNISLMKGDTVFSQLESFNPGLHIEVWTMIVMTLIMLTFWGLVSLFFKTDIGITIRSSGDNAVMTEAGGVNVNAMKILGVALANGFVAISGCFVAQYQGFADVGMGIGTLVIGLASVILGETVIKSRSITWKLLAVIAGAIVYRYMIALALHAGMNPIDLKLITALFVLFALIISRFSKNRKAFTLKKALAYLAVLIIVIFAFMGIKNLLTKDEQVLKQGTKHYKIGIVQISQNGILNITRDAFLVEMKRIGFDENTEFLVQSADSDLSTLNTILDNFLSENVDLVLTISTPATQAAINKIKDIPVVFATVANPFVFGAGVDEQNHLPNVTGTYGWVPMDKLVELSQELFPQRKIIGTMGNRGEANTEFYLDILRSTIESKPELSLIERAITSPNDVYEASVSIVSAGAEVFILPVDNVIYSSFDAILKSALRKQVPIFSSDADRLKDGALVSYGYDYASSGIQAAHLVERVISGENPADIPFEKYKKMIFGLNLEVAKDYNITIPQKFMGRATKIIMPDGSEIIKTPLIGLAQFSSELVCNSVKRGIYDALASSGYVNGININILERTANDDLQMIDAINQDFLMRNVDIIMSLSTPALQSAIKLVGDKTEPDLVFSCVTDPYDVGVGDYSGKVTKNITGFSCQTPLNEIFAVLKVSFPKRTKLGVVWNSSEEYSGSIMGKLHDMALQNGYSIIDAAVTSPSGVLEAARSVAKRGTEILLIRSDNTINASFDSYIKVAQEYDIPVVSDNMEHIKAGAVLAIGVDFYQNGYAAGNYAARIIGGHDASELPILPTTDLKIIVNLPLAKDMGWKIPETIMKKAVIYGNDEINQEASK